jgi:protoporphyrinogen IX oxidase
MWTEPYPWLEALHIIAVMSWMAGMLYLPRLFVYHCATAVGSESSEMLKLMELRLLRYIVNPAMIAAIILGISLAEYSNAFDPQNGHWLYLKLCFVTGMVIVHALLARYRKAFARDERPKSERYFRILNEVPAVLMVCIVITVVFKPL